MASPQREDGHVDIANEIMDHFMRIRIPGEEMQILWVIFRQTWGYCQLKNGKPFRDKNGLWTKKKFDAISQTQFEKFTGIKRRRVWKLIQGLLNKNLIIKKDDGFISKYAIQKNWAKWKLSSKKMTVIKKDDNPIIKKDEYKRKDTKEKNKTFLFGKTKCRFSDEDMQLAKLLHNLILDRDPSYKWSGNNLMQRWANDVRLIREKDKRDLTEIKELIIWSQNNPFWQSNIESIGKLRTKFSILKDKKRSEEKNHARRKTPKGQYKRNPKEGWEEKPEYEALYD